jgi:hypothetical protein
LLRTDLNTNDGDDVGRSERTAKRLIPVIDKVVMVGDEITARELLERLMTSEHTFGHRHFIPHVNSFYHILQHCNRYQKKESANGCKWRRLS